MTSLYSGGLVYEYSEEGSGYGLVTISGTSVTEKDDFSALQSAFSNTASPSGDGGYNSTGGANGCPAKSTTWNFDGDGLPAIPDKAAAMMKSGAGSGPGLKGAGSQDAGAGSTGTASAGSGVAQATGTSSSGASTSSGAKKSGASALSPMDVRPFLISGVVVISSFFGALLL